ncbi:MAG: hypothetical protein J7L38_06885 [Thermoproteales archaeon]|nr:hypothetical protein [Thermoproteales archaeon]
MSEEIKKRAEGELETYIMEYRSKIKEYLNYIEEKLDRITIKFKKTSPINSRHDGKKNV